MELGRQDDAAIDREAECDSGHAGVERQWALDRAAKLEFRAQVLLVIGWRDDALADYDSACGLYHRLGESDAAARCARARADIVSAAAGE